MEELAALIEVPVNELTATVDQWNEFCDRGVDLAFYRPAVTLNKIVKTPFYVQLCVPAMLNTDGGPMRSAKAEVLDPCGNPIPHLYSAGEFGSFCQVPTKAAAM
ncbi:MAG: FAD-binding protein [Coriobacteriales bacterium]|nr:FAD-binding protein [Coriobacteriales bacterium]